MRRVVVTTLLAFGLVGCGQEKLETTETFSVGKGVNDARTLEAKPRPLKTSVSFTASNPVTVAAYRAEDAKDLLSVDPKKALGSKKGKEGTFTIDIPANVEVSIVTVNDGTADAKVTLTLKTLK